jgi:hypothetical protein
VTCDDNLLSNFITFDAFADELSAFDPWAGDLGDSCVPNVGTHGGDTVLPDNSLEDWQRFLQNPQEPLACVSDSDPAYQLGCNRSPSDDCTESLGGLVFPSVSSASSPPNTSLPLYISSPPALQADYPQHSLGPFADDAGHSFSRIDYTSSGTTPSYLHPESDGISFFWPSSLPCTNFQPSATTSTSFTASPFAESPQTPSNLLSPSIPSTTSSSCPPLSNLSTTCSPTPDLRTPDSSQPIALSTKIKPATPREFITRPVVKASRPRLKAQLTSTPLFDCPFRGCGMSYHRQIDFSVHISTTHEFHCELGCPRSFTTRRGRERHYQVDVHAEPGSATMKYQCGGCGRQTSATRRDNHLRHLKRCKKRIMAQYICHCGHPPTTDKEDHMHHVDNCKGKAGRPKGQRV